MKILFIEFKLPYLLKDADYPAGGYAVELLNWLNGLTDNGCQCGVLTWRGATKFIDKKFSFQVLDTFTPDKGLKILKYFYLHIPALLQAARQFRPDIIVQAVSGLQTGMMAFVAGRIKIPFIYRAASDMDADHRYKTMMPWYAQHAYRYGLNRAAAIVCQNQYQYNAYKKVFTEKPLYILHNPLIPINNITLLSRPKKLYIAWLGNFKVAKNVGLLRDIAKSLPDIYFKVGGMIGRGIDRETEEALGELQLLENVELSGYISRTEVGKFLGGAVCLLNTSRYEGFSNTFLEALACGTPVACPARVDPDNIIAQNYLGLTSVKDHQLGDRVRELYSLNADEHNKLSERCREYVLQNHDLRLQSEKFIKILSHFVQNTGTSSVPYKSYPNKKSS